MTFLIIYLVAVICVLVIACHWFYVAGKAQGFSDCYHLLKSRHSKGKEDKQ